jgi:hypothetical protein
MSKTEDMSKKSPGLEPGLFISTKRLFEMNTLAASQTKQGL